MTIMSAFVASKLQKIRKAAPSRIKLGVVGTMRKVFEVEAGLRQFRALKACLVGNKKIELVTADSIVPDGALWAGQLDETEATVRKFVADGVNAVLVNGVNYGDEWATATIAKWTNRGTGCPVYTFVPPDLPFGPDGSRKTDDGCGILPARQQTRVNMGINPGWIPSSALDSKIFAQGVDDMLRVAGGVKAARSVRLLQVGHDQQTFSAIQWSAPVFQNKFDMYVDTLDSGEFRDMLRAGLAKPPEWLEEVVAYVRQWIDFSKVEEQFPDTPKLVALGFGLILQILVDRQLNCVTMNCWPNILEDLRFMVCAINGLFFQHGISAACETDKPGTLACSILQGMVVGEDPTKFVSFFADWTTVNQLANAVMFWHCGPFAPCKIRGGGCAQCGKGWIIPTSSGCAGLLDGKWAEIGEPMTLLQLRPDEYGNWVFVAFNGKVTEGPATIGMHFWLDVGDIRRQEQFMMDNPADHHNSGMTGNMVALIPEVARWLGFAAVTLDNLAA
ncbi:MAG: hypothetical protein WC840_01635 [Candidatus Peribacteraceae bacterium]